MQSLEKTALDHSMEETGSMGLAKCRLTVDLEGFPALEASNRLLGGPRIERIDLTSDPKEEGSEQNIIELNAQELTDHPRTRSISYLPVLGREKVIVKGWSHIIAYSAEIAIDCEANRHTLRRKSALREVGAKRRWDFCS
jgi:hypothetical protein